LYDITARFISEGGGPSHIIRAGSK
jgi:hypothetical protein